MLDLVFANLSTIMSEPLECTILFDTDYRHTILYFNLSSKVKRQIATTLYIFNRYTFVKVHGLISNGSLYNDVCTSTGITESWHEWDGRLTDRVNNCIPQEKNSAAPQWIYVALVVKFV